MRTLVLMLDGVPFEVMDSLWREGRFQGFLPPSRLVSPFPSLTRLAFGSIWGEPPAEGYEDRYFDRETNRLKGGLMDHLFDPGEHAGFHRHIEVKASGWAGGLAYVVPVPMARRELRDLRQEVLARAAYDTTVVAYLVSTDALAHRSGRAGLVRYLGEVEAVLADLRQRFGPGLQIYLFSDHGNEMVATRRAPLERTLRASGFRVTSRLEEAGDVVLTRFGLVGSAFLYTMPETEARLAEALRGAPGVDLVLFEDGEGRIHVWGPRGRAVVRGEAAAGRFSYEPLEGDPLQLAAALRELQRTGAADSAGFAADTAWLRASLETPYIDALRRIVVGMRAVVRDPANVVVSFEPGYHFGNRAADLLVDVTGTHGSLRTGSALGFYMSTHVHAPVLIRSDRLMRYLPAPVRPAGADEPHARLVRRPPRP